MPILKPELKQIISEIVDDEIINTSYLSGGDINTVCKIDTPGKSYVAKLNSGDKALQMFQAETEGLEELAKSLTFKIPGVISLGKENQTAFLLIDYIQSDKKAPNFDEDFGRKLSLMHQNTSNAFGFKNDNFIGTLPQYNSRRKSASEFYIEMRLVPQLKMAADKGYIFNTGRLFVNLTSIIPDERPALVHGDLWSGNAITDEKGLPCLIDPAVFYGHRETDIAMMLLFGGYSMRIFESYENYTLLSPGWRDRIDIWQLYYLLVHLNLFGSSYYRSVNDIITKYN